MQHKLSMLKQQLEIQKKLEDEHFYSSEIEGLLLGKDHNFLYLAMSYGIIQVPLFDLVKLTTEQDTNNKIFAKLKTKATCNIKQLYEGFGAFEPLTQESSIHIGIVSEALNVSSFPFPFPFPSPKPFPIPMPLQKSRIYPHMKFDSPTDYGDDTVTTSGRPPIDDATDDHIKGQKEDDLSIVPTLWGMGEYETGSDFA